MITRGRGYESRTMDERISWEACPRCGGGVVLGWEGKKLTGYFCGSGCELTAGELTELTPCELRG